MFNNIAKDRSENMEFVILATQISTATNNRCMTVKTVNDLPYLSTTTNYPPGQIVFVESINTHVFNSNNKWIGIDNRALRKDFCERSIYTWGNNNNGQLGAGNSLTSSIPVREFCSANNWCAVTMGSLMSGAIKTSGELWTWGVNSSGQLGNGTYTNRCSPAREFCSSTNWCMVSFGRGGFALKTTGELWGWGANTTGALGIGSSRSASNSPVREFCSATDWCQVSAAGHGAAAIKTSGQLWTWGCNAYAQLGDGTTINRCSPVREFCSATDWCQVGAGFYSMLAIKTTGELWGWGRNLSGQLGIGSSVTLGRCSPVREFCSATDWCRVATSETHAVAIKTTGQLWVWGSGANYGLGDGTASTRCSPVREFCSATDWCFIEASKGGGRNTAAIKTSGQLWVWGRNTFGSLGINETPVGFCGRCSPVREFFSANDWNRVSVGYNNMIGIIVR
jgi:alpha-tubulin suppressor-like RCC1 family protein